MKIGIFKNTNISKDDVNTIQYLLTNIKWETIETEFEIKTYKHEDVNIQFSDLNIHIDMISPIGLNFSNYNLFIPDMDIYNKNQNDYLSKINLVLYKTRDDQEKFKAVIDKSVNMKYMGWVTPERLNKAVGFTPKNTIDLCTLMHDENKTEVVEIAKSWCYPKKLKIYTYLRSDDCILDIIGLNNVEVSFELSKMFMENSCYIQIGRTIPNIVLENMCYGNVILYNENIEHEYLSTCDGFVEYTKDNIYSKLDNLSISNNSNMTRNKFINLTLDFIKNFNKIFNNIFTNLEPYEPVLNELPEDLPFISLISRYTNHLLERWFNALDYPKDKLEWLVNNDLDLSINNSKGDYVMLFDVNLYYNPQCIKNRLIIMRDKECVYCAIKPNYNYIRKISSMIIEPVTKKFKDRIVEGSLFFKRNFWKSDWDFTKTIEINWVGVFVGIDTSIHVNSEPNGCHFNVEGGIELDTIEYLNNYRA